MLKRNPQSVVLGEGTFGRGPGHEGGALVNGIGAHIRRDTGELASLLPALPRARVSRQLPANQEAGSHHIPGLLAP